MAAGPGSRPPAPARMIDVAKASGLSIATVSRVLSGTRVVGEDHRRRVMDAVRALDYQPDQIARSLRTAKTHTVGIVVPSIDNPFFPSLIKAAERELSVAGFALLISFTGDDLATEAARLRTLVDRKVDGLLVSATSWQGSGEALGAIVSGTPTVLFDQNARDVHAPFVGTDDGQGMSLLIGHLADRGVRRVAYIGSADDNWSGFRRISAFERAIGETGALTSVAIRTGQFSREYGARAAEEVLGSGLGVDAVVCGNDLIAAGVIDAAERHGRSVPGDLMVTGYDDVDMATMCRPQLTTVRQPVEEMMRRSVEILLTTNTAAQPDIELDVELIVRASTQLPTAD